MLIVGSIGTASHWLLDTSVFHQMASAPAISPHWAANGVMAAIGVAAALIGGIAFTRRDLQDRMTAGPPDPGAQALSPPGQAVVAFSDLTARARIREAALRHFAEQGFQRATIRGIAQTAGVSPGLLRHHYGSKDDLRQECDRYVSGMLRRINAQLLDDPGDAASSRRASKRSSGISPGRWPTGPPPPGRSSTRW